MNQKPLNTAVTAVAELLNVKSLVTIGLTVGFIWQACTNNLNKDFLSVYLVVISFYFGTQFQKNSDKVGNNNE